MARLYGVTPISFVNPSVLPPLYIFSVSARSIVSNGDQMLCLVAMRNTSNELTECGDSNQCMKIGSARVVPPALVLVN